MNLLIEQLKQLPAPGNGAGCYHKLFGPTIGAVRRGVPDDAIFDAIKSIVNNLPGATRQIPDKDIQNTITQAHRVQGMQYDRPQRTKYDKATYNKLFRQIQEEGKERFPCDEIEELEALIMASSPIAIKDDFPDFMWTMFELDDYVYVGDQRGERKVHSVAKCIEAYNDGRKPPEQIAINTFTGSTAETQAGSPSYVCDASVSKYKYYAVEFDGVDLDKQLYFWLGLNVEPRAIVYSGNNSYHVWFDAPYCENKEDWDLQVRDGIFRDKLNPMGVDCSTTNPSRLMRTPGAVRSKTGSPQYLLWLSDYPRQIVED